MGDLVRFQRETDDWAQVPITYQGAAYAGEWSYQIVPYGQRPTGTWIIAKVLNGLQGIGVKNLTAGIYQLYPRADGQTPYAPVLDPVPFLME